MQLSSRGLRRCCMGRGSWVASRMIKSLKNVSVASRGLAALMCECGCATHSATYARGPRWVLAAKRRAPVSVCCRQYVYNMGVQQTMHFVHNQHNMALVTISFVSVAFPFSSFEICTFRLCGGEVLGTWASSTYCWTVLTRKQKRCFAGLLFHNWVS